MRKVAQEIYNLIPIVALIHLILPFVKAYSIVGMSAI